MATVHPSSILRSDDREAEFALFVEDLKRVVGFEHYYAEEARYVTPDR